VKLASLASGRDGELVVVSSDLSRMLEARSVARTLQAALDDWPRCVLPLRDLAQRVNDGAGQPFSAALCAAPLPRAYQWADGSAYVNHVALVRKARKAELPASFWTDPLMYQGGSDSFLAPEEPIRVASEDYGIDFEAEVAVITGDVASGVAAADAADAIRLLMLVNDVSLRNLIPGELAKGFGFFQSKPSSAFSPVAVTPDELGAGRSEWPAVWTGGRRCGHDVLVPAADRSRGANPPAVRRLGDRFGHGVESRRAGRAWTADRLRRSGLFVPGRAQNRRAAAARRAADPVHALR
jgi:fumarylacetoacetate (FAA) hydrolase